MNILLVCSAGMSTSLLVERMKKAAQEEGTVANIYADSVEQLKNLITDYDVILIGPQIRYKEKFVAELAAEHNKKYGIIPPTIYGMVDGVKAFALAKEVLAK